MYIPYTLRVGIHADHYLVGTLEGKTLTITRITDYRYFSQRVFKDLSAQPVIITLQEVIFHPRSHTWTSTQRKSRPAFYIWPTRDRVALSLAYIVPVRNGYRYFLPDSFGERWDLYYDWEEGTRPSPAQIIKKMRGMIKELTQKELELWLIRMSPEYDPKVEISKS